MAVKTEAERYIHASKVQSTLEHIRDQLRVSFIECGSLAVYTEDTD